MNELAAIVRHLTAPDSRAAVLATLVSVQGSSYRRPGARLLIPPHGPPIGSISGGCLEEDVLARAQAVAATGRSELVTYDTTTENDLVWGTGLGCHGVVQVLLEKLPAHPAWATVLDANLRAHQSTPLAIIWKNPGEAVGVRPLGTDLATAAWSAPTSAEVFHQVIAPPTSLVIFGAGHDAQPLVRLAKELGWHVTVADPRAASATPARFPAADAIVVAPAAELVERVAPPADALAVVMTHHYVHDVPLLRALVRRPLAYLGLLGPKQRAEKILADLADEGVPLTDALRARLHAPVGLDLGAENAGEVALAILAEMQAVLASRDARPLRERPRPIHS